LKDRPSWGINFFFAQYLEARGWGVSASGNLGSLTEQDIVESIPKAEVCQEACRAVGEAMRGDDQEGPNILSNAILEQVMGYGGSVG